MTKQKFDFSLLKPVEDKPAFQDNLKPIEGDEDEGAYLDQLPEGESFWKKLPRNILIGLTHAGRNLHNLPHDISKLAEWPAEKIAGPLKHPLSSYLPYDETDYSDVFGGNPDANTLMDSLIQGGIEHAPELISAGGAAKSLLRRFPITRRGAARQLKEAEKLVGERGINNFQMNYPLLKEASEFLPNTKASGAMMEGILKGEYKPAFALQSQVGHHARNLAKSPLAAERLLAPKAQEIKQLILHEMEQALRGTGHHEVADLLRGGITDYAKYMKFKEKALPIIKKLGIPTTGLTLLGLGTHKGKKLIGKIID